MADDTQTTPPQGAPAAPQLDPAFFDVVNKFVQLSNRQGGIHGAQRASYAALHGVARYNCHAYLSVERDVPGTRAAFLDYMSGLYRKLLNEHLDALGAEHGVDVGVSELTYAAPADTGARDAAE